MKLPICNLNQWWCSSQVSLWCNNSQVWQHQWVNQWWCSSQANLWCNSQWDSQWCNSQWVSQWCSNQWVSQWCNNQCSNSKQTPPLTSLWSKQRKKRELTETSSTPLLNQSKHGVTSATPIATPFSNRKLQLPSGFCSSSCFFSFGQLHVPHGCVATACTPRFTSVATADVSWTEEKDPSDAFDLNEPLRLAERQNFMVIII